MRTAFSVFALMGIISSAHAAVDIEAALSKVRTSCGGISEELNTMKTLAGIGTAVSAVGTVAGGAAVATGVMKNNTDAEIATKMAELINKQLIGNDGKWKRIEPGYVKKAWNEFKNSDEGSVLNKKSETLGNIRTGTLAATTATNIAGAAVGGVNMKKARGSLSEQVSECLASVKELSAAYGQARISRTASEED